MISKGFRDEMRLCQGQGKTTVVTPLLSFVLADAQRLVVIACNLSDLMWEMNVTTVGYHVSNEKNLGWLGYIGDYTTQLYRAL